MRTKYILFIAIILLTAINNAQAQQELMAYTMTYTPYAKQLNPANPLEKKFDISLLNIYNSFDVTGPSLGDIGKVDVDGILNINTNDILSSLSNENLLGVNTYFQTLNMAMNWKGLDIDFGHALRQQTHFIYNRDLVELAVKGNGASIGKTLSLGPKSSMTSFHQFNLGLAFEFGKLRLGTNMKFLNGVYSLTTGHSKLDLTTSDDIYQLELDADYVINTTGLLTIREDDQINTNFGKLANFEFYQSNLGFAIDLGAIYQWNDRWKFSASILDIGFINWTEKIENFTIKKKVVFEGLKLEELINSEESLSLTDTLKQLVKLESSHNEYKSKLASSLYLSTQYKLSDKIVLSALYYHQQHEHFNTNSLAISSQFQLMSWMDIGLMYAIRSGSINNLGLSTYFKLGPIRFYAATDNVLAVILPESARHLNFRLGSSLVF